MLLTFLTKAICCERWVKRKKFARTFRIGPQLAVAYASLAHQGDAVTLTFTAPFSEYMKPES